MQERADWVEYILSKPLEAIPGSRHNINTGTGMVLAKIVEDVSGTPLDLFVQENLFDPLLIREFQWEKAPDGTTNASIGLSLSVIDFTKIGYLILKDGIWKGQEIVSFDWIVESTTLKNNFSSSGTPGGVAYYWWKYNDNFSNNFLPFPGNDLFFLYSHNGISIYLHPGEDLLVTIYANNPFSGYFGPSWAVFFNIVNAKLRQFLRQNFLEFILHFDSMSQHKSILGLSLEQPIFFRFKLIEYPKVIPRHFYSLNILVLTGKLRYFDGIS